MLSAATFVAKSGLNVLGEAGAAMTKRPPWRPGVDLVMSGLAGKGCPEGTCLRLQPALPNIRPIAAIRKQREKCIILRCDTGLDASQQAPSALPRDLNCRTSRKSAAS